MVMVMTVPVDRKSGRHLDQLIKRRRVVATPQLLADARRGIVEWAETEVDPPVVAQPSAISLALPSLATLRAVRRVAADAEMPTAAVVEQATQAAATAQQVFDELATTGTFQSDYASQLETSREFHATCATKERHNYLVTLIGYGSRKVHFPNRAAIQIW